MKKITLNHITNTYEVRDGKTTKTIPMSVKAWIHLAAIMEARGWKVEHITKRNPIPLDHLSVRAAAARIGCHISNIHQLTHKKVLPAIRVMKGKKLVLAIAISDIDAYIATRKPRKPRTVKRN